MRLYYHNMYKDEKNHRISRLTKFCDTRERHPIGGGELTDGGVLPPQPFEYAPAGGVGERRERGIELTRILNHAVQYSPGARSANT